MPDLPDRPDLAQLRRQAKDLLRAHRADEPAARRRIDACRTESQKRRSTHIKLTDTQRAVAREHGFGNWAGMKRHIEALRQDTPIDAESGAPDTEADGMGNDTDHKSFAETLERLEELQGAMESMFEPAPGWEWHTRPENRATVNRCVNSSGGFLPVLLVALSDAVDVSDPVCDLRE